VTRLISHSELSTYRNCPLLHHLRYSNRLVKGDAKTNAKARLGTLWHSTIETYWLARIRGESNADAAELAADCIPAHVRAILDDPSTPDNPWPYALDSVGATERIEWILEGYLACYAGVADDLVPLATEVRVEGELLPGVNFVGRADLLALDLSTGKALPLDYKTVDKDPSAQSWATSLLLGSQFPLYLHALRTFGASVPGPDGGVLRIPGSAFGNTVVYDGVRRDKLKTRVLTPAERFNRVALTFTEAELRQTWREAQATAQAILATEAGRMLPVPAHETQWCGWACEHLLTHTEGRRRGGDYVQTARDHGWLTPEELLAQQGVGITSSADRYQEAEQL